MKNNFMKNQLNQETLKKMKIYTLCVVISSLIVYLIAVPYSEIRQMIFGPVYSAFSFLVKIIFIILILGLANAIKYNFFDKNKQ